MGWSEVYSKTQKFKAHFKIVSGIAGLSAVVAMGALGVVAGHAPDHGPDYAMGSMQTGATVTQSTAPTAPETSMAKPFFTFTTPEGFAVPH
ncbi:hypothetical protein KL953_21395 [Mycolicibacterium goodii]|nr:hypothetical protein [Mycolicibacterium goodii]